MERKRGANQFQSFPRHHSHFRVDQKERKEAAVTATKVSCNLEFLSRPCTAVGRRLRHARGSLYAQFATWYLYSAHARRSGDDFNTHVEVSTPNLQLGIYIPPMHGGRATDDFDTAYVEVSLPICNFTEKNKNKQSPRRKQLSCSRSCRS